MDFSTPMANHLPGHLEAPTASYCISNTSGVGEDYVAYYRAKHPPLAATQPRARHTASRTGSEVRRQRIKTWEEELARSGLLSIAMAVRLTGAGDSSIRDAVERGIIKGEWRKGPHGRTAGGLYLTIPADQVPIFLAHYQPRPYRRKNYEGGR